jgi:hypothetical protein
MPTSSKSSWTDKTRLEQAFLRLRYQMEKWPDDPRGGERLRARIRRLMKSEFAQLEACLHDPRDLLKQVKAVSEGQMCLIHIDRTEVRSLFEWRAASYERTAQVFGVEPDDLYLFHESVLDAQVECLYRKIDERIEGAEDDFWAGSSAPGPFMDRVYQLTLDTLSEDECLFVECLAAARKREGERERGCVITP